MLSRAAQSILASLQKNTLSVHCNYYRNQFHRNYSNLKTANPMRFTQFRRKNDDQIRLGSLSADGANLIDLSNQQSVPNNIIQLIKANVSLNELNVTLNSLKSEPVTGDIELLAPVTNPEKIVCIGLNYLGHCKEQNKEAPKEPMFFSKFASTLTGPTGNVILHQITNVS